MNKKYFFKRTAVLALSAALLASYASAVTVNDISGHWAETNIQKWVDAGKISGYEDSTFRPDNNITRAEFVSILSRVIGDETMTTDHRFEDVKEGTWYFDAVNMLTAMGVVAEDTKFNPDQNITREQVMTMLARALDLKANDTASVQKFADYADISDYALDAVCSFVENGYTSGYENDGVFTLKPKNAITRAETVQLLENLDLLNYQVPEKPVEPSEELVKILGDVYKGVTEETPATSYNAITNDTVNYYLGLSSMDGIADGVASEAMMSAVAHSVCLVRTTDGTDANALAQEIRTSVNPRKWICVGVEDENVLTAVAGDYILLVMDNNSPNQFIDSFLALGLGETEENPDESKPTPDANNLMQSGDYYMDYIGEIRTEAVEGFATKVENVVAKYLQNANNIYYAVVPSKQYFVNDQLEKPFDYKSMTEILDKSITNATKIDLTGALELTDYLKTDPHWSQEGLQDVLNALGKEMGFTVDLSTFTKNTVTDFTGQHGYGKDGFTASEEMTYLTNTATENAVVDNFQDKTFTEVYKTSALETDTPYDLFLSGSTPLLTITNPDADTEKELVMFRDSFACSLAPLMIDEYKTITLVDLRYMDSSLLPEYVDFEGKDVLFLYNEQVINHSEMIRA